MAFYNSFTIDSYLDEILHRAIENKRLSKEEGLRLLKSSPAESFIIANVANQITRKKIGQDITFVINRNINFTNVCINHCSFCAFRQEMDSSKSYFLSTDQVLSKCINAEKLGATEVCIQGGLHPHVELDYYVSLIKLIKESTNLHIHAFSPMEISYISRSNGISINEVIKILKDDGLDSIPGTAAEILNDDVRKKICPEKITSNEWIEIIMEAHKSDIPTTSTMLYGHVESTENIIEHLSILRNIQDQTNGFSEFVPLSFVHYNAPLYKSNGSRRGSTGIEDLKIISTSRLFLDNFKNIQASWVKFGPKLAQLMLNYGANDLGGTLMEEKISRSAGLSFEMITDRDIKDIIINSGLHPQQRDTLYNLIN
ncbi:MAG: 7,8-didemethyl-8-hydroxy-5-deazariboflavin synthase subunit CofH [Spirochaetales bacterium]|nr:7,8-didemethyl-8-hydroxy-5-deazariboflavin synthase subunit CofH [Spirochaetales bacterium]|tara:strand:- start:4812 stop:5921 length:1110 start_codon:yes stop_codon:yes gene_type:complete